MRRATKKVAVGVLLLWGTLSFAWEKRSNEFQFPNSAVRRGKAVVMKNLNFSSYYNRSNNSISFTYSLPQNTNEAVLNIYSINGSLVKSFFLKNDVKTISWNVANEAIAMGTYAASLKCGAIEKNHRLLIVK